MIDELEQRIHDLNQQLDQTDTNDPNYPALVDELIEATTEWAYLVKEDTCPFCRSKNTILQSRLYSAGTKW